MNTSQWIASVIESKKNVAVPIMTHPGIEIIGKKVIDAVTNGQVHFESIKALNERFPQSAACTTIMDLTVEAEAFGAELYMSDEEVPSVTGRLLSSHEDVAALEIPTLDKGRIPEYLKANKLAAENIDKPTFGGCIGPFSLAGRLYDMTEIMMAIYTEPETMKLLLGKCTTFLKKYIAAIKQTGVAGVILAEPAAGLLSNDDCYEFSSVYVKEIVDELQDDNFAIILHNCGNAGHCTQAMIATGANGYHFGNKADMVEALKECPTDVLVMGNIDPVALFKEATPDELFEATKELLAATSGYKNFVISSGCDTPPGVSFDNITAFYNATV
ncbi:methylcobamide--CoM methyltransferase [Prevotella sp. 10(H)]|uniref:methylcobamide--CoM methyltransferase n=1 Tax=Prevotella sp. 10(H) TaxID=1158294 RepID=UPI0004A72E37|nr:methylcobamide--CoM methyltransferase [Prevotella sp. 10(H)]